MLDLPPDLPDGAVVTAAVSGGADSVALLDLLIRARRWRVWCWHLDHGLRPDSAEDARFVAELAARLGAPCRSARAEVRAALRGDGIEEAARRVRYALLRQAACELGAAAACTAHHRDDQAETALLQILRGCGPEGPAGIAPERPLAPGVRLLRPLLRRRRQELIAHCLRHGLPWREDPSNADLSFARNRLRHRVLPQWEAHCPGIIAALAALAARGGAHRRAAAARAAGVIGADAVAVEALRALDGAARMAAWRELCARLGIEATRGRLRLLEDLLAGSPGRALRLGRWLLRRRGRALTWNALAAPLASGAARAPSPPG
ncbi:MAG: tRNA lysidine(34) synthetase TilS [Planctomycetes bacterium]|nr:tRNA lysidine(34) synthetase TilS [Planctomycetota bacterium]